MIEKFTKCDVDFMNVRINQRCMTLCDFAGVPAGTKGTIKEKQDRMIVVQWDNLGTDFGEGRFKPLRDGFTPDELKYLAFKEER